MKNKEYVERYADRLAENDKEAVWEITVCFINEYNSEVRRRHVTTDEQERRLINDLNRKGNELKDMFLKKKGVNVLANDWFSKAVFILKENSKA